MASTCCNRWLDLVPRCRWAGQRLFFASDDFFLSEVQSLRLERSSHTLTPSLIDEC